MAAFILSFMTLQPFLFGNILVSAAVISPSNDSVSLCNGFTRTFTCETSGATLAWLSDTNIVAFSSILTSSRPLSSDINTHFVSAGGGMVVANATVTGSPGLNGTTLECRNTSGIISTTARAFVNFTVEASSAATSTEHGLHEYIQYKDMINIIWGAATCFQFYNISVNKVLVATTNELSYTYTFFDSDEYNFEVLTIGYLGDIIGVLSETFYWKPYAFRLELNFFKDEDSLNLNFIVRGLPINQPPINNCTITIESVTKQCEENDPITFYNVTVSSNTDITYNVTIVNDAGVSSDNYTLSGDLEVNVTRIVNNSIFVTVTPPSMGGGNSSNIIGDPVVFAIPFIGFGGFIVLSICWIGLRICWKRQCFCPRIWRSSFWLIFFCYDCCTYHAEEKEGNTIGLKNPNVGEEKGGDTSL